MSEDVKRNRDNKKGNLSAGTVIIIVLAVILVALLVVLFLLIGKGSGCSGSSSSSSQATTAPVSTTKDTGNSGRDQTTAIEGTSVDIIETSGEDQTTATEDVTTTAEETTPAETETTTAFSGGTGKTAGGENINLADYISIDNTYVPYGFSNTDRDSLNRPNGCNWYKTKYGMYDTLFLDYDSNKIYLTFDAGYENGYTAKILDTLKEKGVKGAFFITLDFATTSPDNLKRMINEGHVVGNHTITHPSEGFSTYTLETQYDELSRLHNYVKDNFGYEMRFFRYPTGAFSEQSLSLVGDFGYTSVFWSFAHRDWVTSDQPDVASSLQTMLDQVHPGEIFLLHAVSSTNTALLGDLIDGIRAKGYEFGTLNDLK